MASYGDGVSILTSLNESFCTICEEKIISIDFVTCADGRPYHKLCLKQRKVRQHLPENGCPGQRVEENGTERENSSHHFTKVECPSQQVREGMEYTNPASSTKQEHRILSAIMSILRQRYSGMAGRKQTVKMFAMTDDEFVL